MVHFLQGYVNLNHKFVCRCCMKSMGMSFLLRCNIVQVPGPKKWLILGVSFTHLVKSRDLFFLEAELADNILQWNVLKNMRQMKSYDEMFQAIKALTVHVILKTIILSEEFLQSESIFSFPLKCFDLNCTPRIDTTVYIAEHHP